MTTPKERLVRVSTSKSAGESPPSEQQAAGYLAVRVGWGWQAAFFAATWLTLLATVAILSYESYHTRRNEERARSSMAGMEQQIQELQAGISFDSGRRQLLLGIRDEILRINPRVSLSEAFEYARYISDASEKYPSVEPLLLLAIGAVESGFRVDAVSHANARGLYQISPSTGRLLARGLGWEYTDDMVLDPEKNTELAALYLDILFAAYNDVEMVLAEYNGGPLNAGYFRAGVSRTAAETRNYVFKVLDTYGGLKGDFGRGVRVENRQPIHRDPGRRGKALWQAPGGVDASPGSPLLASTER